MERKELTDLLVNSVKGSSYVDTVASNDYLRTLDNYYRLAPDTPDFARKSYLRSIQDTLVSLNDIQVEGIINKEFMAKVGYSQKASAIGSLLAAAMPLNPYVGALGLGCLALFAGITIAKHRVKKQTHLKDMQKVADELAPVRDELKKVELQELDYVLQQNKAEIMPYLGKDI
ncbi:MAG: hypothetical protein QME12_01570 [Nanoarchaeota archaeon]|nr:hypothetical protein [Nanoarchaeota archaeon]